MNLSSPAAFLPAGAFELIRESALAAERSRNLHPAVLECIYREGWFRLLVPRRWGGRALALPQLVRLEEGLAFADGSVGWVVTLCSGAGWFGGFLPDAFGGLFSGEQLCVAGSGSVTGEAWQVDAGWRVSGDWVYASGIRHATAVTANCVIGKGGEPLKDGDGHSVIRPFVFLPEEVVIRDDWNAMGMVATGSHGFSAGGVLVPEERAFVIDAAKAMDADPLYQYPFLPLAEATLTANILGMGLHFLDCCAMIARHKGRAETLALLDSARQELAGQRAAFYAAVDHSWAAGSTEAYAAVGRVCHELAGTVRKNVDLLYVYMGLGAARIDTEINRVWRDLHTAGQHPLLV
jgi:hypothetical protein